MKFEYKNFSIITYGRSSFVIYDEKANIVYSSKYKENISKEEIKEIIDSIIWSRDHEKK